MSFYAQKSPNTSASSAGEVRLSNTALVKNMNKASSLLYFDCDWLSFFIGGSLVESKVFKSFEVIFDNYDENDPFPPEDFIWLNTEMKLSVKILRVQGDLIAYLSLDYKTVIQIRRITDTSTFPISVKNRYRYYITFGGTFFVFQKMKRLRLSEFINNILDEEGQGILIVSMSLIHICFDFNHQSTRDVRNGIKIISKAHAKEESELAIDPLTKLPGTIYYGRKSDNYHVCIYNKLLEITKDKSERFYKEYLDQELVTRVELRVKSANLKKFSFSLRDVLDGNMLLGLVSRHLDNHLVKWEILNYLEQELNNCDVHATALIVFKPEYNELPKNGVFKKIVRSVMRYCERFDIDHEDAINAISWEIINNPPL